MRLHWGPCWMGFWCLHQGIVPPKMKILSSFTHPLVVPNLHAFLSSEKYKLRCFEKFYGPYNIGSHWLSLYGKKNKNFNIFFVFHKSQIFNLTKKIMLMNNRSYAVILRTPSNTSTKPTLSLTSIKPYYTAVVLNYWVATQIWVKGHTSNLTPQYFTVNSLTSLRWVKRHVHLKKRIFMASTMCSELY